MPLKSGDKKSNKKRKRKIIIAGVLILVSIAATFLENVALS